MNFERGREPTVAMGLGHLGKRGISVEWPYLFKKGKQIHIKYLVWAIAGWNNTIEKQEAIFEFPALKEPLHNKNQYVVTAAFGEETHYDSIYRKIEYSEILMKFFQLVGNLEFMEWIDDRSEDLSKMLKFID